MRGEPGIPPEYWRDLSRLPGYEAMRLEGGNMTLNKGLFSSQSGEWETPHDLFDRLWEEFGGFGTDPCCERGQHSAERVLEAGGEIFIPAPWSGDPALATIFGPSHMSGVYYDGLKMSWHGKVYMNPPYGREIGKWVEKAVNEVENGNAELVVALLPARTDTRWFQTYVMRGAANLNSWAEVVPHVTASEVHFLPGRLKFVGAKGPAPFPSAIVVWRR